ncbi:NEDD4-binding protein 1 [Chanos chanos]|uniref:NEDD4-binding protein 1-like n=1 Tax=Chanos chanos TaxID=29144 RepID=A0A6J2VWK6_CHACN|nr:NEDD4-binding protein 1-like [Chanos chanos]XP_030636443.1 NEDD4-binding protein 1-like [Chanos chanos]
MAVSGTASVTVEERERWMRDEPLIEDEFTCAGALQGSLVALQPLIKRVFGVALVIEAEGDMTIVRSGQIWLRLQGRREEVDAAKLFVKGVVNQEAQRAVQYPEVLDCTFCGARGLFMDCLIRNTSAHVVVVSSGSLHISGLELPVIRAYSLILDLLEKYNASQGRRTDATLSGSGETLESRRAFKALVERWEDRHTLDLLVLPAPVKEVLLDLVKQAGLDTDRGAGPKNNDDACLQQAQSNMERLLLGEHNAMDIPEHSLKPIIAFPDIPSHSQLQHYIPPPGPVGISVNGDRTSGDTVNSEESTTFFRPVPQDMDQKFCAGTDVGEQASEELEQSGSSPQEVEEENVEETTPEDILLSVGSRKEFEHLLKFFTAMGFTEDVVRRVLTRTGPREASQILDLVQQEQAKDGGQQVSSSQRQAQDRGTFGAVPPGSSGSRTEDPDTFMKEVAWTGEETMNEDFLLEVMKMAAASCGYTETEVSEIYSNLPELKPHELLLELQKKDPRQKETVRGAGRERSGDKEDWGWRENAISDKKRESEVTQVDEETKESSEGRRPFEKVEKGGGSSAGKKKRQKNDKKGGNRSDQARFGLGTDPHPVDSSTTTQRQNHQTQPPDERPLTNQIGSVQVRGPPLATYPSDLHPTLPNLEPPETKLYQKLGPTQGPPPTAAGAVTGVQRFLEGLQMPFELKLTDDPGDTRLRQVIIDGSNVAMSHGLGQFFSCRGIALAVQYFWNRGHRKITVFIPQWRMKRDPKIKEQHFLTQLQDLGLLSLTPSREVMGKRINSYDDRFMLQMAQKTDGVIVTNDNLRDLYDESQLFRDIIKKRLLQYLFAGDLFMVPDDPLGRNGPHLNDFLCTQNSLPVVRSHTFAGVASFVPPVPPQSQTEVLRFRDWTPGGDRGRRRGPPRSGPAERSMEETLGLKEKLIQIFPDQDREITLVLQCNPTVTDINSLSDLILEQQRDNAEG